MSLISDHPEAGWLYLLENQHIKAVKVGKTDRNPHERANELSKATGVPGQFRVAENWWVINSAKAEKLAHDVLREHRIPGGEFFRVSVVEAIQDINRALGVEETGEGVEETSEGVEETDQETSEGFQYQRRATGGKLHHYFVFLVTFVLAVLMLPVICMSLASAVFGDSSIITVLSVVVGFILAFKSAKWLAQSMVP